MEHYKYLKDSVFISYFNEFKLGKTPKTEYSLLEEGISRGLFTQDDVGEIMQPQINSLLKKIISPHYDSQQISIAENMMMSLLKDGHYLSQNDIDMAKEIRNEGIIICYD